MNSNEKLQADFGLPSLPLAEGFDEDLSSFISNLIDQNAALIRKLQEFDSLEELANRVMSEAYEQAQTIISQADKEANARTAAIIRESEEKAKLVADKIMAEAKQKGEGIIEEKRQMAIQHGLLIIQKAQDQALAILDEVEKQTKGITEWKRPSVGSFAFQQRLKGNKVK